MNRSFLWNRRTASCTVALIFALSLKAQDTSTGQQPPLVKLTDSATEVKNDTLHYFNLVKSIPAVHERKIPAYIVTRLKKDDDYWYASGTAVKKKVRAEKDGSGNSIWDLNWVRVLFWTIVIGIFVSVIIWFLASGSLRIFRKPAKRMEEEEEEVEMEDIFSLNYEEEIPMAIKLKNFRQATRLLYLRTLKDLSKQNRIQYKQDSTNREYLLQLSDTPLFKDFFRLTRNFEYTWYGQFSISGEAFESINRDFSNFKKELNR